MYNLLDIKSIHLMFNLKQSSQTQLKSSTLNAVKQGFLGLHEHFYRPWSTTNGQAWQFLLASSLASVLSYRCRRGYFYDLPGN